MSDLRVDTTEWEKFGRNLEQHKPKLWKRLKAAMQGALDLLLGWIVDKTPVNTGALRGSFTTDIQGTEMDLRGTVMTPILYGLPVEEGRAPGRMPPVSAIKLWARRKLGLTGRDLDSAAYLIARHIGAHGTKPGAQMVEKALNRAEGSREIDRIFESELEQFARELVP